LAWADRLEWLFFNAAQGARHPAESAITYLTLDNAAALVGTRRPGEDDPQQNRYKYSPTHQDMAVCCAPNAGRIMPYYVKSMWLRTADGLLAALYGPSVLTTEIAGTAVCITQETAYPFDLQVDITVDVETPLRFALTPWAEPDRLQGTLINDATGLAERVTLRPLGSTVLRQVTLPSASG
jgi:hypothetical protein